MVVKGRTPHRRACLCCAEAGALPFSLRRANGDAALEDTWSGLIDDDDDAPTPVEPVAEVRALLRTSFNSLRQVSPPAGATAARRGPSSPHCSQHAAAFRGNASVDNGAQGAGLPLRHRRGAGRRRGVRCAACRRASAHARQVALSRQRVAYKPKQSSKAFIVQPCHQPRRQSCAHSGVSDATTEWSQNCLRFGLGQGCGVHTHADWSLHRGCRRT